MKKSLKYFNIIPVLKKTISNGTVIKIFRNGNVKTVKK